MSFHDNYLSLLDCFKSLLKTDIIELAIHDEVDTVHAYGFQQHYRNNSSSVLVGAKVEIANIDNAIATLQSINIEGVAMKHCSWTSHESGVGMTVAFSYHVRDLDAFTNLFSQEIRKRYEESFIQNLENELSKT